ncbi:L,D-transpeptidase family protein [Hoeflea sp.]|uniref:L,D-transpeptidase family protein n=1 Tax=Hoeflea sp. TaxID=1940281 RepID=UPI0032EC0A0B
MHFRSSGKVINTIIHSQREHLIVKLALQRPFYKYQRRETIAVRRSPSNPLQGIVRIGPLVFRAALGRGGLTGRKREGDGATPVADLPILAGFRRGGMPERDSAGLRLWRVGTRDGWCDAPGHASYNRPVRLPFRESHEKLLRDDVLYDFGFVLDWNLRSRRRGLGSAIFLHVAKPGYPPTEGCIALSRRDMLVAMPYLGRGTILKVFG